MKVEEWNILSFLSSYDHNIYNEITIKASVSGLHFSDIHSVSTYSDSPSTEVVIQTQNGFNF